MTKLIIPGDTDILLILDLQNDFCAGGALAVPGGDEIVPIINNIAGHFAHVLLTQDWHPRGHHSFASAHPGRRFGGKFQLKLSRVTGNAIRNRYN